MCSRCCCCSCSCCSWSCWCPLGWANSGSSCLLLLLLLLVAVLLLPLLLLLLVVSVVWRVCVRIWCAPAVTAAVYVTVCVRLRRTHSDS